MPEVCTACRTRRQVRASSRSVSVNDSFEGRPAASREGVPAPLILPSKYQNPVENPYGLLPRPPQTQAAHFKRLYRK
jgi:hypothetical protein